MNGLIKPVVPVVLGVLAAGLIMHFLKDMPLIGQAHGGFDS
jgi:hypothetical protein